MSKVESYSLVNPFGDNDECAKLTVDDLTYVFVFRGITNIGQQYTFSFWVKSDSDGILKIQGEEYTSSTEWVKHIITFDAETEDFTIEFGITGVYYMYHTQLEIGNKATDYNSSPDDVTAAIELNKEGIDLSVKKNEIISAINLSSEEIRISAEKIKLEGLVTANDNFKILEDGSIEAVNGKFTGNITSYDGIDIKDVESGITATIGIESAKKFDIWYVDSSFVIRNESEELTCLTISSDYGLHLEGKSYINSLYGEEAAIKDLNAFTIYSLGVKTGVLDVLYINSIDKDSSSIGDKYTPFGSGYFTDLNIIGDDCDVSITNGDVVASGVSLLSLNTNLTDTNTSLSSLNYQIQSLMSRVYDLENRVNALL